MFQKAILHRGHLYHVLICLSSYLFFIGERQASPGSKAARLLDLVAEALDPTQPLTPADDVSDAGWFSMLDLEQKNIPISDTTLALLKDMLKSQ